MKKRSLKVIRPLVSAIIVHLTFSYARWDLNPVNWSNSVRGAAAYILICAVIITIAAQELWGDK